MASVQQITYQMIIDYLSPNKVVKNKMGISNFPTKENIVINVNDFPKKIKRFFNKNFFRYGVLTYDTDHNNISLYSSILTCLDSSFITMNKDNKVSYINAFRKKLKNDFINNKLFKKFKYGDYGISEKVLLNELSNKVSMMVIQSIIDYLSVNIILFNFDDQKRYLIHSREVYNVYYPTLIIGFSNDYYEPIFTNKKKSFTYNDKIIKKIMKNDVKRMSLDNETQFSTNKDVYSIIQDIVDMNQKSFENSNEEKENSNEDIDILTVTVEEDTIDDDSEDEEQDDDDEEQDDDDEEGQDDVSEITESTNDNISKIEEIDIDDEDDLDDEDEEEEEEKEEEEEEEYELNDDISKKSIQLKDNAQFKLYKKFSKSKWNKMRKDELLDVINNLKLNVGKYQNKKKSEVIHDIIQTISLQ